ncbi:hypothetical protein LYNGBM3L_41860 [Moorena producens 3L]|uniref:Uncharacterized protein n=1 Tax=Moorena producens 3L TaxID=489825 RepID=F4XW31_9CYAN|nr:hypothetical protein LYNGBM3L_41860 [Moorena producens 3L]
MKLAINLILFIGKIMVISETANMSPVRSRKFNYYIVALATAKKYFWNSGIVVAIHV